CNMSLITITVASAGRGRFPAPWDGRVLVESSDTPFLDAARALASEGVDPATRIVMRHQGQNYDALTSTVVAAAKLTVKEVDGQAVVHRLAAVRWPRPAFPYRRQ